MHVGAEKVEWIGIGNPCMIKRLALFIIAKIWRLAPLDSWAWNFVYVFCVPIFLHLVKINLNIRIEFFRFFLSYAIWLSNHVKHSKRVIFDISVWKFREVDYKPRLHLSLILWIPDLEDEWCEYWESNEAKGEGHDATEGRFLFVVLLMIIQAYRKAINVKVLNCLPEGSYHFLFAYRNK